MRRIVEMRASLCAMLIKRGGRLLIILRAAGFGGHHTWHNLWVQCSCSTEREIHAHLVNPSRPHVTLTPSLRDHDKTRPEGSTTHRSRSLSGVSQSSVSVRGLPQSVLDP